MKMEVLRERPDIVSFVENVVKEQGIKNWTIIDAKTNDKGEGYLGQIFMISVKDTTSDILLDVVVKTAFVAEKVRKRAPIRKSFLNEICFYTELAPQFEILRSEHGLPPNNFTPKCYKVCSEEVDEKLCLENMKALNFESFDKKNILDDDHVRLIFEVYGRFHAYTFALKTQKPEEYAHIVNKLYDIYSEFMDTPNSVFKQHFNQLSDKIKNFLVPGEEDKIIRKFEKYLNGGIIQQFDNAIKADDYSTILHGDCWSNNMLFKYEQRGNEKKLVDMRLLDLQIIKVGSPACDLAYCLYSGASKTVFDNLDTYLKIYHKSLSETLTKLGSDPEKVFPFDVLKQHWKLNAKFGMIMAFSILQLKAIVNKEDIVDLTDDFAEGDFPPLKIDEKLFEKKIKELLYHMSEIDAL